MLKSIGPPSTRDNQKPVHFPTIYGQYLAFVYQFFGVKNFSPSRGLYPNLNQEWSEF